MRRLRHATHRVVTRASCDCGSGIGEQRRTSRGSEHGYELRLVVGPLVRMVLGVLLAS